MKRVPRTSQSLPTDARLTLKYEGYEGLNEREAAKFLGVARPTLNLWRRTGRSPAWLVLNGWLVRYRVCDLVKWQEQQRFAGGNVSRRTKRAASA